MTAIDKKKPRQRMRSDLRKEQLLSCAVRVVARNGLGASGHAATAEEAKVSVPTVFAYFPTREALLGAVVENVDNYYENLAKSVLYQETDTFGRIISFVYACAQGVLDEPDRSRIWLDWSSSIGQPEIWKRYVKFDRKAINRLTEIIKQGQRQGDVQSTISPKEAAMIINSGAHTTVQLILTQGTLKSAQKFQEALVKSALHMD